MNKKKSIFIILCMCLLVFSISLKADSGWDGSYGGGSSSGGSSSWGSSSGGSSWSSSSGGSGSSNGTANPIVSLIVLSIFIYLVYKYAIKGKSINNRQNNNFKINPLKTEVIKETLPDFDKNEFRQTTFKIYKDIQIAWMNFDYKTIKKNTTNELYNIYHSQLLALKAKKQKNIMKEFELLDFEIVDMEKSEKEISLKVRSLIKCYDYVINENDKVLRGTNNRKVMYNYEMTFTKGIMTKNNKCPNCNAPLENVTTSTCPYCNSTVISNNHDWVLSKKQMISQEMD